MTNPPPPGDPNQWGAPPPPQWQPEPPAPQKNKHVWLYVVFGTVAALLIAGGVWVGVVMIGDAKDTKGDQAAFNEPEAKVADGGIVLGEGKPKVDLFVDFGCPACKKFENDNGNALAAAIEDKKATVIFHPLIFLDGQFTDKYSSRSAAASVCAADEGKFYDYYRLLMDNQPVEGGAGLDDKKLIELGEQAGLGEKFSKCASDETYRTWITRESEKTSNVTSTPTVLIDGKEVESTAFATEFAEKIK